MTRSQRRTMTGFARLRPNRREALASTLSWVFSSSLKAVPEFLTGTAFFCVVFLIIPVLFACRG